LCGKYLSNRRRAYLSKQIAGKLKTGIYLMNQVKDLTQLTRKDFMKRD